MVRTAPAKSESSRSPRRHLVLENADAACRHERFQRGEGLGLCIDGVGELQQKAAGVSRRGDGDQVWNAFVAASTASST